MLSREKLATFAALFAAALASVATSPPHWHVGEQESGEVTIGETDQTLTFRIRSSEAAAVTVVAEANVPKGERLDTPVVVLVSPRNMYRPDVAPETPLNLTLVNGIPLEVALQSNGICAAPCEEDVTLVFQKRPGQPAQQVHWTVKTGIGSDGDEPDGAFCEVHKL